MATKIELLSHEDKTLSPITKASNVLFENGKTAQDILNDKQDENFTPKITSSSSMFKVGQGDNADYSSNVANGAYESIVLKGKTMVNYIQEPSSQDVVLPYEFTDGQSVTINDTKESGALGIELKGQTLVNIHKLTTPSLAAHATGWYENLVTNSGEIGFDVLTSPEGWRYIRAGYLNYQMLKPNTKYLIVFESSQNISSIHFIRGNGLDAIALSSAPVQNNKAIITTSSQIVANEQILYVNFRAEPNTKVSFKNPMIIEYQQGMENWSIPYFEGMASCKMPILRTVGKNLFDGELITGKIEDNGKPNTNVSTMCMSANYTRVQPNTTYNYKWIQELNSSRIFFYDANKNFIKKDENAISPTGGQFTTPSNCYYILFHLAVNTEMDSYTVLITKSNDLTYEPYKSSILQLPEEVVLRSLPNGVRDTFNTRTGVYTQRIGEAVVNGSEDWELNNTEGTTTQRFFCSMLANSAVDNNTKGTQQYLCDRLRTITWSQTCELGVTINGSGVFVYNNSIEYTVSSVKQWLSQNPVKLQYELATPVVTKINLSSTLKTWNTTTHIYSEIPESTLYPILSHSNPSYPVILKPSTKYSIVANSYSNSHTNSAINFNLGGVTASTTVGNRVTTITTPSTLSNELLTMSGRGNKLNNVMVIEGDVVGDEPYFEGICDCKSPILSNVGKNLVNVDNYVNYPSENIPIVKDGENSYIIENKKVGSWQNRCVDKIKLKANTTYTLSYDSEVLSASVPMVYATVLNLRNDLDTSINVSGDVSPNKPRTFTPTQDMLVRLCMYATDTSGGTNRIKFSNIQLEESSSRTTYEPYKSNTTTFDQKDGKTIVLRSLPSGVCDTLNVETGELTQRIGEVVLDGTETNWSTTNVAGWENTPNTIAFGLTFAPKALAYIASVISSVVCDKFSTITANGTWGASGADKEGVSINQNSRFDIRIERTKLPDESLTGFKQWLSQNPIVAQYELETPIVSTIDVQGFPFSYENGHVILSSGSIEQSLTPTVEYSVATNRNGQIRSNQKMVERHQKELDKLQAIVLANLVNSQYNQTLTTLNYELSRV